MLIPEEWIRRYPEAAAELRAMTAAAIVPAPASYEGFTETAIAQRVRAEAFAAGRVLWRNNVGQLLDARGVPVRYGLMNESKAMNARNKSPDYIGIKPVLITQAHVGTVIGQFYAREIKKAGWTYSGDTHEIAQLNAITIINNYGGDAAFTTGAI
jgi:hypothetical protein